MCPLGCKAVGSLRHILCGCRLDEQPQSRITWRHDSVLLAIFRGVLAVSNRCKKSQAKGRLGCKPAKSKPTSFKSSSKNTFTVARAPEVKPLLETASDWKLQFDVSAPNLAQNKNQMFPAEILETSAHRPDGVIWSSSTKTVIWIELTCPWEENMSLRHFEKQSKYNQLAIDCKAQGWTVYPLCVEVGCRGYVAPTFHYMCHTLGFTKSEERELKYNVERTAQYCSHAIFVHRYQRSWEERPPLDVSKWMCPKL